MPIDEDELKQKVNAVLKELDELIEARSWDESSFLRAIGKDLRDIRDNFINEVGFGKQNTDIMSQIATRMALRSGQREIFIALYSSDGANLSSWERILHNLPRQLVSRPIYADEADVKASIKSKINRINEAYVSVYVSQADLITLPTDKIPVDKLGKPLLTLKDKALSLDNVSFFVHQSIQYQFIKGHLVKNG